MKVKIKDLQHYHIQVVFDIIRIFSEDQEVYLVTSFSNDAIILITIDEKIAKTFLSVNIKKIKAINLFLFLLVNYNTEVAPECLILFGYRSVRGYAIREIARLLNMSPEVYNKLEKGYLNITEKHYQALAELFMVETESLYLPKTLSELTIQDEN